MKGDKRKKRVGGEEKREGRGRRGKARQRGIISLLILLLPTIVAES